MKKQILSIAIVVIIAINLFSVGLSNANDPDSMKLAFIGHEIFHGNGTEDDPYMIYDVHDLQNMSLDVTANYALANDIDATVTSEWNNGTGFVPIGNNDNQFTGSLEGNNHRVIGLYINRSTTNNGLFGYIDEEGTVSNLGLVDVSVKSNYFITGGLVGRNWGIIENTYVTGFVNGDPIVGGLVGWNDGTIINAYTIANVFGSNEVGGLVGSNRGNIDNTYATGDVNGNQGVGGLVGDNSGTVSYSYATGTIIGTADHLASVGGLIGRNTGTLDRTYSTGPVTGYDCVGGLVGENSGFVNNSYTSGSIDGDKYIGGLVGVNHMTGRVNNSHYNVDNVLINDEHHITIGGLFDTQYNHWISNGLHLNIEDYDDTLVHDGEFYNINDVQGFRDMLGFSGDETLKFRLSGDVDFSSAKGLYIPYFTGEFNGYNYTIYNLSLDLPFTTALGMFAFNLGGTIRNIGLVDADINGYYYVGGLVGRNFGLVADSFVSGEFEGITILGGLIGDNDGTVEDSFADVFISGARAGGLVGYNRPDGNILGSYASGNIAGTSQLGGLVGLNNGFIRYSYSTGDVDGTENIGGLIGYNSGFVECSYSKGEITGNNNVGGLAGFNSRSPIINSYSVGNVTGNTDVGGLVGGVNTEGDYEDRANFWDVETSGTDVSAMGIGMSTSEMKSQSSFTDEGWDFEDIWWMVEDLTYPFLWWQHVSVSITSPFKGQMFSTDNLTATWIGYYGNTGLDIDYYEVRLNEGEWENMGTDTQRTFTNLEDGEHVLNVKVYDVAGNHAEDSVIFHVNVPKVNITSPTEGAVIANINVTIEWTGTDGAMEIDYYEIMLNDDGWVNVSLETSHEFFDLHEGENTVFVKAIDDASNFALDNLTFLVDITAPTINVTKPSNGEYIVSNDVTIEWTGSDTVSGISSYEIRLNGDEWVNMGLETKYQTVLEEGSHVVDVKAYDIAGNYATDSVHFFVDITPPSIIHTPPNRWHMYDDMLIEAVITDDIHLQSVYLEYSFAGGSGDNVSMNHTIDDTYAMTLDVPGTESTLVYTIWATDGAGLTTHSGPHSVPILNLTAPSVIRVSQDYDVMPINGIFNIEFSKPMATDIISACGISPEVHFETDWNSSYNLSIVLFNLNPETQYTFTINRTKAVDLHGIPLDEDITYVFTSQGPPQVTSVTSVEEIDKGFDIRVETEVQGDVEISEVTLLYTSTNNVYHQVPANYSGDNVWLTGIPRQNRTGEISYRFKAVDISGLITYSETYTIFVKNPSRIYPLDIIDAEADTPFDFNIRVTSPVGVIRVVLHYTCPKGQQHSVDLMLQEGDLTDGSWGCKLTADEGQLTYQLEIIDADGENIILPSTPAYITVNEKPVILGGYLWHLLLILVACAAGGGAYMLWKRRPVKDEQEIISGETAPATDTETQQLNNTTCTICFGQIEEPDARHGCIDCGNSYHKTCIYELGECPVCGKDPLAGVKDEQT